MYNGSEVPAGNYTVSGSSTVITLKENYVNGFAPGTYHFTAVYSDGNIRPDAHGRIERQRSGRRKQRPSLGGDRHRDNSDHRGDSVPAVQEVQSVIGQHKQIPKP